MTESVGHGCSTTGINKEVITSLLERCRKEHPHEGKETRIIHGNFHARIYDNSVIYIKRRDSTTKRYEGTGLPPVGTLLTKWYNNPMDFETETAVSRGYMVIGTTSLESDPFPVKTLKFMELINLDTLECTTEYTTNGTKWLCCLNRIGEPVCAQDPDAYIEHVLRVPLKITWESARISPSFSMEETVTKLKISHLFMQ